MFRLVTALLAAILSLSAQAVNELALERQLTPENTLTATPLALPEGAFEIRERLIYNPSGATLTSTIFTVQPGAPLPTPLNASLAGAVLGVYTLNVEKVFVTAKPFPAVAFTGTVSGSSGAGVLGDVFGLPFMVSFGYKHLEGNNAEALGLTHTIAGRVTAFSTTAAGTLVIPRPPAPPANPTGPQIVISAPFNTVSRQIELDASKTTDDSGTSLTFTWRNVNKSAVLLNPNTPVVGVQFTEGPGDYFFEVTVTNGNGQTAKKTVTVIYLGR